MELVSMAREQPTGDKMYGAAVPCEPCPYPYGLRLNLSQEQLAALGYTELPPAGTTLRLEAVAVVTRSASEDPDADGDIDYLCVEMQITEMGVEQEGETDQDDEDEDGTAGRAERMYAKGKQPA